MACLPRLGHGGITIVFVFFFIVHCAVLEDDRSRGDSVSCSPCPGNAGVISAGVDLSESVFQCRRHSGHMGCELVIYFAYITRCSPICLY
jgi:hypothetical protein